MTDDELRELLRAAVPPVRGDAAPSDTWPVLVARIERGARWSLLDIGLAAAVAIALAMFPEWLWPLAYHL